MTTDCLVGRIGTTTRRSYKQPTTCSYRTLAAVTTAVRPYMERRLVTGGKVRENYVQIHYVKFLITFFNCSWKRVHHFADDPLKRISLNENIRLSIKISRNIFPWVPIENRSALVKIMACRLVGANESMMVNLLTHICVTRPQWHKSLFSAFSVLLGKCAKNYILEPYVSLSCFLQAYGSRRLRIFSLLSFSHRLDASFLHHTSLKHRSLNIVFTSDILKCIWTKEVVLLF